MITRRRHEAELQALRYELAQKTARLAEQRAQHAIRHRRTRARVIAAAVTWLEGRAAGYRADADATPSKPKTGPLTDDLRRAIASELETAARDLTGLELP